MTTKQPTDATKRCMLTNGTNSNDSSLGGLEMASNTSFYTKTDGGSFALHDGDDGEGLPLSSSSSKRLQGSVDPVLAEKEQWAVFWSRVVVIVVMVAASSMLSSAMYSVISRNERDDFETQFLNHASEIHSVAQQNARNTIATVEAFSATLSSYARATQSTWPFVTVRDFPARADRLVDLINATGVTYAPIVTAEQRMPQWFEYSTQQRPIIVQEGIEYEDLGNVTNVTKVLTESSPMIFGVDLTNDLAYYVEHKPEPSLVAWQSFPMLALGRSIINLNLLNLPRLNDTFRSVMATQLPALDFVRLPVPHGDIKFGEVVWEMSSQLVQPIFDTVGKAIGRHDTSAATATATAVPRKIVGMLYLRLDWVSYFDNLVPPDVRGITIVLSSTCSEDVFTYRIQGGAAVPLGLGDLHEPEYDDMEISAPFVTIDYDPTSLPSNATCISTLLLSIYPSREFEESFYSKSAINYTLGVLAIFAFASFVFTIYDWSVRCRQAKVMARVLRQDRIVSDLFPTRIRQRLYGEDDGEKKEKKKKAKKDGEFGVETPESHAEGLDHIDSAPLAELFPAVTVVFADVVGFTAWASQREPSQVFTLLETIYSAFDKIAYRHSVFKIETVGDCYVAVAGLPEERQDHALAVARFARDCLHKMRDLTSKLEVTLGPDTADLDLRVGLHSGQVTAGVLRGERSRFQLFGDTVNTAARMESTSVQSCIQISSATAGELKKWKRGHWIRPRDQRISVKGKGEMQTYWLETKEESIQKAKRSKWQQVKVEMAPLLEDAVTELDEDDLKDDDSDEGRPSRRMTKTQRLVEWNVVVMGKLLRQILAARGESPTSQEAQSSIRKVEDEISGKDGGSQTVLGEFKEIVTMPLIRGEDLLRRKDPRSIALPESVVEQLRHFLTLVAGMYRENPFHNFEHASHVTASVRKLLTRIVKDGDRPEDSGVNLSDLAGHSYGITSDPITQFAVVFSAAIHDAGHPGVPNAVLLQENTRNAQIYKKSIAEQHSVDLVWSLLMKPEYGDLRACIYSNEEELRRFRQLVVNIVMATDIVDKELQALRKARWETAFATTTVDSTPELDVNRKATIVLEHIIQASDVSHTMQHWHVYIKWNEKFFFEQFGMYKAGRVETDPSISWYQGEIGFFDFYIIPLAKKLQSCGCFGVSSHEYLNYAMANREEWAREGECIVQEYLAKFELLEGETVVDA